MKSLMREQGFSLIQVLLLSSALAASALVAVQTFKQQKDILRATDTKDNVEHVHKIIYAILQNRNHCLETITHSPGSKIISPGASRPLSTINMVDASAPAFEVGATHLYLNNTVSIQSMELILPPNLKELATLNINYLRQGNHQSMGALSVTKKIMLSLQRKSANEVQSCSSVTVDDGAVSSELGNEFLNKEICEDFDTMIWDENLRVCALKDNLCPPASIFVGLDANGDKVCKELITFLPFLIDPSFVQTCPADFNQIKLNRAFTFPYLVSIECNKQNETCPSNHLQEWTAGPSLCQHFLPRGTDGQIITLTDDILPSTGTASYLCDKGAWKNQGPLVCIAPCEAQSLSWAMGGGECSAEAPKTDDGAAISLTDAVGESVGSSGWRCSNGSWGLEEGAICSSPCIAGEKVWSVNSLTCSATVPALSDGGQVNVSDNTAPEIGAAEFKCLNGVLTLSPGSSCNYPAQAGQCKWASQTSWENDDCSGLQVKETPNTTVTQAVSSPQECAGLCNTCNGTVSYNSCTFTAD
jgi:hypothetical protein